ncbi:MAG TPA: VWA domain-containing protein [Bryobacteraceae bacterium]|nr:VWA domain-containing protein [Bryobacteraceae bacterium]
MRITGTAAFFSWLLAVAALLTGQTTLRVESTLVVVPVSVTDKANRFVIGLEKQNFRLYEDGAEQKISQFSGEDVPLSIGILVDISASMGSRIGTSRQAVAEFLKTMNAGDEAFLEEFNDRATLQLSFTRAFDDITNRLADVKSDGTTALIDAVDLGVTTMKDAHNPRKALLLVSDGGENSSHYSAEAVKEAIQRADVQVYAMGVFDPLSKLLGMTSSGVSGPGFLANLCEQTGGREYAAGNYAALPTVARRIGIELRNQYVLAFTPLNHEHTGDYRKLEVKVTPPDGMGEVKVRWRNGYYAK